MSYHVRITLRLKVVILVAGVVFSVFAKAEANPAPNLRDLLKNCEGSMRDLLHSGDVMPAAREASRFGAIVQVYSKLENGKRRYIVIADDIKSFKETLPFRSEPIFPEETSLSEFFLKYFPLPLESIKHRKVRNDARQKMKRILAEMRSLQKNVVELNNEVDSIQDQSLKRSIKIKYLRSLIEVLRRLNETQEPEELFNKIEELEDVFENPDERESAQMILVENNVKEKMLFFT